MRAIDIIAFAIIGAGLAFAAHGSARATAFTVQCVNAANGTAMTFTVDDRRRSVNGMPAEISDSHIAWQDKSDGGSYELHRTSGNLTVRNGGHVQFNRCQSQ